MAGLREMLRTSQRMLFLVCPVLATFLAATIQTQSQTLGSNQESSDTSNTLRNLSDLELTSAPRLELESALNHRDFKRAEAILVREAERDPKSVRAGKLLRTAGGVFFIDGQYKNAVIAWKKAEAIAPLDDRSRFTLAMAYIKLNKRDWARTELDKLVAENPREPLYLYWLARLDYDARNYSAAMSRLKTVIELDPNMARAYDALGLCYDYLGKFDEAIADFHRAVELNRKLPKPSPWPLVNLSNSLVALNRLSEAEESLREAVGYDGDLPQTQYQLGRVLEMQGRYQDALSALQLAAKLAPGYAAPHYLLGRIYHRLGDDQRSKAEISRFEELRNASEAPAATGQAPPKE
jgi:tetratricopeptide (TPR) repeat protein